MRDAPLVPIPPTQGQLTAPLPATYSLSGQSSHYSARLFAWFNEKVANRLAWIDGPKNPWRQLILPLSQHSDTVFLSLLALTAHDLASQYTEIDPWHSRFRDISALYTNKALARLAHELRDLSRLPPLTIPTTTFSLTLGSVMLICNSDLLEAQTAEWRIHLAAAREIILAGADCLGLQHPHRRVEQFLLQEFYATSVWTHLTTFSQIDDILTDPPTSNEDAVLADFVRIIHNITQLERRKTHALTSDLAAPTAFQVQSLYARLESAKSQSLTIIESIDFWSDLERRDFELVVLMYYHATLVYLSQTLSDLSMAKADKGYSCGRILNYLQQLSQTRNRLRFTQDLVWPLFIAGTELRGDRAGQEVIEKGFTTVMNSSRALDRSRVVSFLRGWWNREAGAYASWIDFARGQSSQCNFLIV